MRIVRISQYCNSPTGSYMLVIACPDCGTDVGHLMDTINIDMFYNWLEDVEERDCFCASRS